MKKIILGIMLGLFIAFMGVNVSLAKDITFADITNKFMENYNAETDTVKMTSDDNSLTYSYIDDDISFSSVIKHDNGIITYEYQDSNSENEFAHSLLDAIFLQRLLEIILELREIDINTIDLSLDNVTFAENGIEIKYKNVNVSDNASDSTSTNEDDIDFDVDVNVDVDLNVESVEYLKIDINKLNLPLKSSDNNAVEEDAIDSQNNVTDSNLTNSNVSDNNTDNETSNSPQNNNNANSADEKLETSPQTGTMEIGIFLIFGITIGLFYKYFICKKNKMAKI